MLLRLNGQRYLLGRNTAALKFKYPGLIVNGSYTGKLDNGGETIRLSTPTGITVLEVTYQDRPPWPVTADGMGWSLVLDDPVAGDLGHSFLYLNRDVLEIAALRLIHRQHSDAWDPGQLVPRVPRNLDLERR